MNLLLLVAGFRAWSGPPVEVVTRALGAVSLFALEMQLATWTGLATRSTLVAVNVVVAAGLLIWARRTAAASSPTGDRHTVGERRLWIACAGMAVVVAALAARLPLEAADPYHLERIQRIEQTGTLAYDPDAHPKVNVLGWVYELSMADLGAVPLIGPAMVRGHGLIGLVVYALTARAIFQILQVPLPPTGWLLVVMPVVFHQFVMVKNDLFGGIPAALALAWIVGRGRRGAALETAWAGWLSGLAAGVKLTSFPLLPLYAAAVVWPRTGVLSRALAAATGGIVGLVAAGLLFVLIENVAVYGAAVAPFAALGNRTGGVGDAATSLVRFIVSLVDMGLVTRAMWPGRGGWGGTYGLPVIWALAVLVMAHRMPLARRALAACTAYWLLFAAVYPDADVAHRLALAPGIVAVAAACTLLDNESVPAWLRRLAPVVGALSALQIVRSAVLYLQR